MIERYTRPAMGQIWSEDNKLAKWLEVELLACEALAERGEVPLQAVARLRQRARVNVAHPAGASRRRYKRRFMVGSFRKTLPLKWQGRWGC